MQARHLHPLVPADPLVARGALEHARLPAQQGQPAAVPLRDVAQPAAGELPETQVMLGIHELVPFAALVVAGEPQHDVREPEVRVPTDRIGSGDGNGHARPIPHLGPGKQVPPTTPGFPETSSKNEAFRAI